MCKVYASNGLKIVDKHSIYLINNTYDKEIMIYVLNNIGDEVINHCTIPINISDMSENDAKLIKSIIKPYINNNDSNDCYDDLMIDLLENMHDEKNRTNNNLINSIIEAEENKIKEKEKREKKEKQYSKNQKLRADIILILNKVTNRDDNPKGLNRSDLSEYLAKYLNLEYGLILRSNVNTAHLLNTDNNCYELTDHETILKIIGNDFGHNTISMKEVLKALDYIDNRIKPDYNTIRFNNCIYDMKQHEIIKLDSPLLPYYDIYFNYNPNAKGDLIQEFLYSSLNEKQVKGLLELIGYLFSEGNKENIIICFIGKGGSGKSVLSNILRHLFVRVSNLPIHNLNKEHELSILENKLLNICNDTDNKKIKDNGTFKQITGNDSLHINPKYRMPYIMPPQEVPKFIIVGNHFPQFEKLEIPIIERLMLIEFKKGFRNTKEQKKNLYDDIIANKDNIEWLIYNGLQAYKEIDINNKNFSLKKTTNENLDLYNKHTNPLLWIVKKLLVYDNDSLLTSDFREYDLNSYNYYIPVDELKQRILTYANNEGLDIVNENNNLPTKKLTNAIKSAFDLWDIKYSAGVDYKPIQKQMNKNRHYVYPNVKFKENAEK